MAASMMSRIFLAPSRPRLSWTPCRHIHIVAHHVVSGDVGGLYCGVVMGPAPVFPPPKLDLACLVLLDNDEGGRHEDISRRWVDQAVEQQGHIAAVILAVRRCLARPTHSAQSSFLSKLGQQSVAMFAHLTGGELLAQVRPVVRPQQGTWASGNRHPGAQASLVWAKCALSCRRFL